MKKKKEMNCVCAARGYDAIYLGQVHFCPFTPTTHLRLH